MAKQIFCHKIIQMHIILYFDFDYQMEPNGSMSIIFLLYTHFIVFHT